MTPRLQVLFAEQSFEKIYTCKIFHINSFTPKTRIVKKVFRSLYNYGNNGKDKRTYLTYNKPEVVIDNKVKKNIDLEDCSWKEIQTIAKEFGLKRKGKGINKAYLKKKIKDELPFY